MKQCTSQSSPIPRPNSDSLSAGNVHFHSLRRKWIGLLGALAISMAAVGSCQSVTQNIPPVVATKSVTLARDVVWAKTTKFITLKGITPSLLDKENGVITASGTTVKGQIIDCATRSGEFSDCKYSLSIAVDANAENETVVSVRLNGEVTQALIRHAGPFRHNQIIKAQVPCYSNGTFEQDLFDYLK